ncbi:MULTISPECIES: hypothetical protein [Mycobacterium avium complex (MAC)]|uniref:hypothetical protein n=1 Tax=Mycobacterium avium complex (MAC) TaxID=120793 RepID=UPI000A5E7D6B|nr:MULTISPECIES: hypothetical protein [Mycobacterium avium complex (MAC)]MBZ4621032.1 hypothetical protein [Mycobacterium avium subsp. hominissuis]MCA4730903.1 hypothetical protein [Mycobacterium avium subsp. hominissuis]MDO2359336.1 hypothetical protein [Mycobacterium avium subsp. hominissuis]UBV06173.1 hypothetical protein H8Z54_04650 [Mycobacterium avium subsp. hominissuis]
MNFYPVSELYEFTPDVESKSSLHRNPLTITGALNDAEFIDMRLSPQRSRVGILCDIQWCCGFEGSNTALVVVTGVGNVVWSNDDAARQRPWHARYANWEPIGSAGAGPPFPQWNSSDEDMRALDASDSSRQGKGLNSSASSAGLNPSGLAEYILKFGRLSVSGLGASIYIGHIEGIDGAPPDMGELSDAEIIAGFPQWSSIMEVRESYSYVPSAE